MAEQIFMQTFQPPQRIFAAEKNCPRTVAVQIVDHGGFFTKLNALFMCADYSRLANAFDIFANNGAFQTLNDGISIGQLTRNTSGEIVLCKVTHDIWAVAGIYLPTGVNFQNQRVYNDYLQIAIEVF
jgi:hypothetical protein